MATQEQIEKILALSDAVIGTPIDSLVTNVNWGSINFETARNDLKLMFGLCVHLKVLPLEVLPNPVADSFTSSLTQAGNVVTQIKNFSIENANPTGVRDQIVNQVRQYAEHLLVTTQSWIPFLAYQKGDIQKNIESLSKAVKDAKEILESSKTEVSERKNEISSIVTAAREASASAGVGVFTSDFDGQAKSLEIDAGRWLDRTMWLAVATVIFAALSFFIPIDKDATGAQIAQYMTSKIVVLAVFITATLWCGRIYKALKHQVTINNHRANALKTFQAFVKAASTDNTRDAVLLETTRSIFAISPSGYLDTTDAPSDANTRILEVFKGAASGGRNG